MPAGAYRFSGPLFFAAIALQSFETTPRD
jgi:hypothetical protein